MPSLAELQRAAYRTELVLSRRLARKTGLAEYDALAQTLTRDGLPLAQVLATRAQARADDIAAKAARKQEKIDAWRQKCLQKNGALLNDATVWTAWFDGSARPNPGRIGLGGILKNPHGEVFELCAAAGHGDSNEAEYLALIAILETAVRLQAAPLVIYGDSRVVIDSLRSDSHAGILSDYHAQARALLAQLPDVVLRWVPRHQNAMADALSQQAVRTIS